MSSATTYRYSYLPAQPQPVAAAGAAPMPPSAPTLLRTLSNPSSSYQQQQLLNASAAPSLRPVRASVPPPSSLLPGIPAVPLPQPPGRSRPGSGSGGRTQVMDSCSQGPPSATAALPSLGPAAVVSAPPSRVALLPDLLLPSVIQPSGKGTSV